MSKRLYLILLVQLVLSLATSAQDRTVRELFNETERDTSWVKDLVINCYVHYVHERSLDSLDILAEIVTKEAERLDYYWGRFHGLGLKGESMVNKYPDSTIYYTKEGVKAIPKEDDALRAVAYYNMAITFNRFSYYDSALSYLEQVIEIAEKRKAVDMLADTYRFIGIITRSNTDFSRAIRYNLKALSSYDKVGDSARIVDAMENISVTYDDLKDYEMAYEYLTKSIALSQQLTEKAGKPFKLSAIASNNLGRLLVKLKRYDEAFETLREAVSLHRENKNVPCAVQFPYYNLGNAFLLTEQPDSAAVYLNKAINLADSCTNYYMQSLTNHDLGELNYQQGRKKEARQFFKKALEGAEKRTGYTNEYIDAAYKLYTMYREEGNITTALKYHEEWSIAKDSLYNMETTIEMARLEIEYDFDREKRALLANQEKEQVALESELKRQRIIQWASLAGILLVLILAINFFISMRRKKKANEVIGLQNAELSAATKKLEQLSSFKDGMTNMIAHDMKNSLNTILGIDLKGDQINEKKANLVKLAGTNILNLVTNMLDVQRFEEAKVRLNTELTSVKTLFEYAKMQIAPLLQEKSMRLELQGSGSIPVELDLEIIGRVLINLLTNAIKFSPSGQVVSLKTSVDLDQTPPALIISVTDAGPGIDTETLPHIFDKFKQAEARVAGHVPSSGLGLTFCKLAIEAHKGRIWAESTLGEGTTFFFTLPLNEDINVLSPLSQPDRATIPNTSVAMSQSERAILAPYALRMKALQIHEIKKLKEILKELEDQEVQSDWPKELWSAILYGNKERYQELLDQIN